MWLGLIGVVALLLAFDLGVLHRGDRELGVRESLLLSAFYGALGLGFGGFVSSQLGEQAMVEYLTGFVVEKSLALDNVFVIAMIVGYPAIPRKPVPSALLGHPRGNRPAGYFDRIGRHSGRGVRLGALPGSPPSSSPPG